MKTTRTTGLRFRHGRCLPLLSVLAIAASFVAGCSDESPVPVCDDCGRWTRLTTELGRFPQSHPDPAHANIIAYSTIRKAPGSAGEDFQNDEDIWLLQRGGGDPSTWVSWQVTTDDSSDPDYLGRGDNFMPRWSPSGDQIAFVHTAESGEFEIWAMMAPGNPPDPSQPVQDVRRLAQDARDPTWLSESQLLFTRDDKIYVLDVTKAAALGGENQLSFDPPTYASPDDFIDRSPHAATDGGTVFSTRGRRNVADVFVSAYEISGVDSTLTDAFLYMAFPASTGSNEFYPLFEGMDTLRTPLDPANPYVQLRSIPVDEGGDYVVGVRRDSRFLPESLETYCDTTLTAPVRLDPGDADSLSFYFRVVRGDMIVTSDSSNVNFDWRRLDDRVTADDYSIQRLLQNPGDQKFYGCILAHAFDQFGQIDLDSLETIEVVGRRGVGVNASTDTVRVTLTPGDTTIVTLYENRDGAQEDPSEWYRGRASFADAAAPWNDARGGERGASLSSLFRQEGDVSAIWRLELLGAANASLTHVVGSAANIQTPAISPEFAGGVRYLAYTSDEAGGWDLYVQRLVNWVPPDNEGPVRVEPLGSSQNYDCTRKIYHPSWVAGSSANDLRLLVVMSECPDNTFGGLGSDEDPWDLGEFNVWEVALSAGATAMPMVLR